MSPLSKAARAQSPDARPTVSLRPAGSDRQLWEAYCSTGACTWKEGPTVKTAAMEYAKRHRDHHRRIAADSGGNTPTSGQTGYGTG